MILFQVQFIKSFIQIFKTFRFICFYPFIIFFNILDLLESNILLRLEIFLISFVVVSVVIHLRFFSAMMPRKKK